MYQLETKSTQTQLETTKSSNAAPCAGTTNTICAVFNVGPDTSDGATNGNGNGNNGNGYDGNGYNGNGFEQETKKITQFAEETSEEPSTLEPTFPTFVSS